MMTTWDNPYPLRRFQCPGCRRYALPGQLNTWVVQFERDGAYDHFLWACPAPACPAKVLVLPAAGALEAFVAAGYRMARALEAPHWIRLMIRAQWQRDPALNAPILLVDQERYLRQVKTLHGIEEFHYLCGS